MNAVVLTAVCTIALSLLNLVTDSAFRDVLYTSVTATMAAYVLSIFCILFKRIRGQPIPKARWTLGKAGFPVNCVALIYGTWSLFWSLWPERYHITAWSFNWALIVFVILMSVSALLYYRRAKKSGRELNAKGDTE